MLAVIASAQNLVCISHHLPTIFLPSSSVDTFDTAIGSSDDDPPGGVRDGLWAAAQILQADTSKATKRVMVLTNEDDPFRGSPNEAER